MNSVSIRGLFWSSCSAWVSPVLPWCSAFTLPPIPKAPSRKPNDICVWSFSVAAFVRVVVFCTPSLSASAMLKNTPPSVWTPAGTWHPNMSMKRHALAFLFSAFFSETLLIQFAINFALCISFICSCSIWKHFLAVQMNWRGEALVLYVLTDRALSRCSSVLYAPLTYTKLNTCTWRLDSVHIVRCRSTFLEFKVPYFHSVIRICQSDVWGHQDNWSSSRLRRRILWVINTPKCAYSPWQRRQDHFCKTLQLLRYCCRSCSGSTVSCLHQSDGNSRTFIISVIFYFVAVFASSDCSMAMAFASFINSLAFFNFSSSTVKLQKA